MMARRCPERGHFGIAFGKGVVLVAILGMVAGAGVASAQADACAAPEARQLDFWLGTWSVSWTEPDGTRREGVNVVEREGISFSHPARFILIGTMNPEEGMLRPQLLDRLGLCVQLDNANDPQLRSSIDKARLRFDQDPQGFAIVPHGHNNMCTGFVVLRGRWRGRHYDRVAMDREHCLLRPTIDRGFAVGECSTVSDHQDNVHWFVAETDTAYLFNVHVAGYDPEIRGAPGRFYVDPAGEVVPGESLIRSPRMSSADCHAKSG